MTTAFILAGGLGLRLRTEISEVPKPMAPINGHPFLEYLLNYWALQGITKFVLSVYYLNKIIIKHFGNKYKNIPIEYFIEQSPMGTGGSLLKYSSKVKKDFIVLNGDTFLNTSLKNLKNLKSISKSDMVMTLVKKNNKKRYEQVIVNQKKKITKMIKSKIASSNFVNGGVYLVNPSIFDRFKNIKKKTYSLESDIIPRLLSDKCSLVGLKHYGKFIDIGLPSDYKKAKSVINKLY